MVQTSTINATVGLMTAVLAVWPDLAAHLPDWLRDAREDTAVTQAVTWATQIATGQDKASPRPIQSKAEVRHTIFARMSPLPPPSTGTYVPLKPLSLKEEVLFPSDKQGEEAAAYQKLHDQLAAALADLRTVSDPDSYLTAVFDLLRRYTYCLPNPYSPEPEPETSLFDHSRIVAAVAASYEAGSDALLLVNGDLSGVQDFIYTVTARGALSGLRGRSLYLQLLTDAIAAYLCRQLGLPTTSLIFASGGHFLLAAPRSQADQLTALQRTISQILLGQHDGMLYLALGVAEFTRDDFKPGKFGSGWQKLSRAAGRAKRQRFSELDEASLQTLFVPQGKGGEKTNDCSVCHYEGADVEKDGRDDDGETIRKCALCRSLEELGRDIRQATHLLVTEVDPQPGGRTWQGIMGAFGQKVVVLARSPASNLPQNGHRAVLTVLGATAAGENESANENLRQHLEGEAGYPVALTGRYLVNQTPLDEGRQIVTMTALEEKGEGIDRVGVLRMDVDDLGDLFVGGFGKEGSLVKTTALSQAMSLYFEGWVGRLCEQVDGGRNAIYSIYSGGDDLFIIGAWHLMPELAHAISQDLRRYAANHPAVHVSGGITLHHGKFPLYQMAQAADKALEAAKRRGEDAPRTRGAKQSSDKKNALTFLNRTVSWAEYEDVKGQFEHLLDLMMRKAPASLLQRLLQLDALYQQHKQEQHRQGKKQAVYWGPWHWQSVYQLARLADSQGKRNKAVADGITAIRNQLSGDNFKQIEQIGLAARWAQLYTRKTRREQQEEVSDG